MKTDIIQTLRSAAMIIWIILVLALCSASAQNKCPPVNQMIVKEKETTQPKLFTYPVIFFQKFISGADGDRCRMYPSCSHYAIKAFKKHGNIMGWIMTCDRLVRCGRDEIMRSNFIWINGKKRYQDLVEDNDFWWQTPSEGYNSP